MSTVSISPVISADELKEKANKILKPKWACCNTKIDNSKMREALDHLILAAEKYYDNKDYETSIKCYKKSLPLSRKLKDRLIEANINFQIAYILLADLVRFEESFEYLQNSRLAYLNAKAYKEYLYQFLLIVSKYNDSDNTDVEVCNNFTQECYTFIFNDIIINQFQSFNDEKDKENINIIFLEMQRYYISKEKYSQLLIKVNELNNKIKNYKIFENEVVYLEGLIILINFLINNKESNKYLEEHYKKSEAKPLEEELFENIKSLIEAFYNNDKLNFLTAKKSLEKDYKNGILDKVHLWYMDRNNTNTKTFRKKLSVIFSEFDKESRKSSNNKTYNATKTNLETGNIYDTQENLLTTEQLNDGLKNKFTNLEEDAIVDDNILEVDKSSKSDKLEDENLNEESGNHMDDNLIDEQGKDEKDEINDVVQDLEPELEDEVDIHKIGKRRGPSNSSHQNSETIHNDKSIKNIGDSDQPTDYINNDNNPDPNQTPNKLNNSTANQTPHIATQAPIDYKNTSAKKYLEFGITPQNIENVSYLEVSFGENRNIYHHFNKIANQKNPESQEVGSYMQNSSRIPEENPTIPTENQGNPTNNFNLSTYEDNENQDENCKTPNDVDNKGRRISPKHIKIKLRTTDKNLQIVRDPQELCMSNHHHEVHDVFDNPQQQIYVSRRNLSQVFLNNKDKEKEDEIQPKRGLSMGAKNKSQDSIKNLINIINDINSTNNTKQKNNNSRVRLFTSNKDQSVITNSCNNSRLTKDSQSIMYSVADSIVMLDRRFAEDLI